MKGGIRQRSPGTWQLNVYLGRGADGHHKRNWETVRGTKADAQRRLRELLAELERGVKPPERVLLKDWLQTWVTEHVATNRSATTVERYEGIMRRQIVPALGHIELSKLTPFQVQSLENRLLQEGMAPKSVVIVHAVLSGAYRYAMRMEVVSRNPVALVSAPSIRKREIQPPPVEVVAEMLHIAKNEEHPKFPCIHLLAYTGLRLGEALGLTWNDVDMDDGHLVVRASLSRRMAGLVLSPPKTSSGERKVDLDAGTVAILRDHRIRQDEVKAMMGPAYKDAGVVFCNGFRQLDGSAARYPGSEEAGRARRTPGYHLQEPAPFSRLGRIAAGNQHRGRVETPGPRQRVDHVEYLRPFTARVAEAGRRGFRGGNGSDETAAGD